MGIRELLHGLAKGASLVSGKVNMKKVKVSGDRNQCAGCGELFNSTAAFDKHRNGVFGFDRRCKSNAEMIASGMAVNNAGFWITAKNPMFKDCE